MDSNKKRIAVIAGAALLVVIAAVAVWYTFFSPPGKTDYQNALKRAEEMSKASGALDDPFVDYSRAVSSEFRTGKTYDQVEKAAADEKTAFSQARDKYVAALETLGEQKAMRNAETKESYDAYVKQNRKYLGYIDTYIANYALYYNSITDSGCAALFDVLDDAGFDGKVGQRHKKASENCVPQLEQLAKSSDKNFANYAKKFLELARERQKNFDALDSGKITGEQAADRNVELSTLSREVTGLDPLGELLKTRDDSGVTEVYSDLKKTLQSAEKKS